MLNFGKLESKIDNLTAALNSIATAINKAVQIIQEEKTTNNIGCKNCKCKKNE